MRSGLKRCTGGSDQSPATPEDTVQPGLGLANGQVQGQSGHQGWPRSCYLRIFAAPSPFPPLHTLGGGPCVDGEGAGGIAVKLSGEPCTNNALHKVQ